MYRYIWSVKCDSEVPIYCDNTFRSRILINSRDFYFTLAFESDERCQTISGDFLSVSLLTMPGICIVAPCGHSPFTHIQDGCVDLVVVENVERKEFVRYIRRFSNTKNQVSPRILTSFLSFSSLNIYVGLIFRK